MDRQSGNVRRLLFLLSLWAGTAQAIQICAERKQFSHDACDVELSCSTYEFGGDFEWYKGIQMDQSVDSGQKFFAGKMLTVPVGSETEGTVYGCKETSSRQEIVIDLGATCGFQSGISRQTGPSYGRYLSIKATLTALFLALCLAILVFTCYVCREPSSKDHKMGRSRDLRGGEEGIYSALKEIPPTEEQSETGPKPGLSEQADTGPKPGLSEQADSGPKPGLSQQAETGLQPGLGEQPETGPKPVLSEQADSGPKPGLSEQPETGPKPGLSQQEEIPIYTALKKKAKNEDYRTLNVAKEGQENVIYTADDEAVQISA